MPLFDFKCHMCGNEWEDLRGVAEPNGECPSCTSIEISRLQGVPYVGNIARQKIMDRGLRHGAEDNKNIKVYINRHGEDI